MLTLAKFHNLSMPRFSHLLKGNKNMKTYPLGILLEYLSVCFEHFASVLPCLSHMNHGQVLLHETAGLSKVARGHTSRGRARRAGDKTCSSLTHNHLEDEDEPGKGYRESKEI